ncbi:MAG TPA: cytochrome d ubiquinol oxidase subunit II [Sporichthyaceae bacterium]|nr:cytochrome d ubiquinol oxidase subunit II [Sporichthyaceae bacterium]
MTNAVAAALLAGVVAYAVFGGADFGAGFWDLTAGGAEAGRRPRALVDHSIGPVWEANHTWLIYCLVVLWTAFPDAFAAIMTTLYIPLGLAALGIVLRGSGFAFRKAVVHTEHQRVAGATFAVSSVITPFFFGTIIGGIASGRVPTQGHGDAVRSWVNPSSMATGALAVAICAYLAAVFLTADAHRIGDAELQTWFGVRAALAAAVAGVTAAVDLVIAHHDAPRLFDQLTGKALPLTLLSVMFGSAALALMRAGSPRLVRFLAGAAVAALVAGWGAAQHPYLLGTHARLSEMAAPHASLTSLVVITAIAAALIGPSFLLLYLLQ